jgi:hypothetical protein
MDITGSTYKGIDWKTSKKEKTWGPMYGKAINNNTDVREFVREDLN